MLLIAFPVLKHYTHQMAMDCYYFAIKLCCIVQFFLMCAVLDKPLTIVLYTFND